MLLGYLGSAAACSALVMLLTSVLPPLVVKIRRGKDKPRSGTLEILSGGDDAKFELVGTAPSNRTYG